MSRSCAAFRQRGGRARTCSTRNQLAVTLLQSKTTSLKNSSFNLVFFLNKDLKPSGRIGAALAAPGAAQSSPWPPQTLPARWEARRGRGGRLLTRRARLPGRSGAVPQRPLEATGGGIPSPSRAQEPKIIKKSRFSIFLFFSNRFPPLILRIARHPGRLGDVPKCLRGPARATGPAQRDPSSGPGGGDKSRGSRKIMKNDQKS